MPTATMRRLALLLTLSAFTLSALALTMPRVARDDGHDHTLKRRLPSDKWYQRDDHPAHALFRRGPTDDGNSYPPVGSPEWSRGFPPPGPLNPALLPQEWVDALDAAVAAGKIPNIPPSAGANLVYPNGLNPMSPQICSTTSKCRSNDTIWDAPPGVFGISFDDGPLPTAHRLYQFLEENNEHATHFLIGVTILQNPAEFLYAFETLQDDIAVHTWTHRHMTTLDNMSVLGELGWTMQLIYNSTGGRIPRYWRPPYGDSDNRVNAIAREIFGLETIIWNQDTEDWSLTTPRGTTPARINASMTQWLTGPKTPGLIVLEHELSDQSVQAFIDAYPVIKSNGWQTTSLARMDGFSPYQNAGFGTDSPVTPADGVLAFTDENTATSSSSEASPSETSGGGGGGSKGGAGGNGSSSSGPLPTGATGSQQGGASSIRAAVGHMRGVVAAAVTLILTTLALA